MKKTLLFLVIVLTSAAIFASIPPRTPFVVLKVNGVEYKEGAEISVRSGERVQVEAILKGGKRDYCSDPQTYANVGRNTVITSQGENGMTFDINGGEFHGDWRLSSEKATFSSGPDVVITPKSDGKVQRSAEVEFKPGNYSKVFFKVSSVTEWHYVRNTPAGKTEQDETNNGTATFHFVIEAEEGVWYSSNNIKAIGTEDFSIRNNLDRIQSSYNQIEKSLLERDFSSAEMHFENLKNSINELKNNINKAKEKDKNFECEINLIGLPSDITMKHIKDLRTLANLWKDNYDICTKNVTEINSLLLNTQLTFTNNIFKSVIKNYVNWGTSVPSAPEDLLSVYDPSNIFGPVDLPRKVLGWVEEAEKDASILKDQISSMQKLKELQAFYQNRIDSFIKERREFINILNSLKPAQNLHNEMQSFISSNPNVNYIEK
ncbi:MAG: hypothetical protein PHP52_11465 [Bacteroidales bacterium]|nr:hypothetical protein [Bacteroidales bacterium]MDD4218412.1 hypothetical protein [Bacteroidales bacterium]MDY0143462.1 hypothetical protein [Bacteroidales bacterium]